MKICQININKSKVSNDCICHFMSQDIKNTVYLVQEPYYYKGKIPGIPNTHHVLGLPESRAVIIAPKFIPLYLSYEFSLKDQTICLFDDGKKRFFLCSIYLDIHLECVSRSLVQFCDYVTNEKMTSILGLDSNSHSVMWGSNETNTRGEILENFIMQYNITVLNIGKEPTFESSRFSTIIDITLKIGDDVRIHSWRVNKEYCFSDHKRIEFDISLDLGKIPTVKKVNWGKFHSLLRLKDVGYFFWTNKSIEAEAANLEASINDALVQSTYETPLSTKSAKWWNVNLAKMKQITKKLAKARRNSEADNEKFISSKKSFQKEIRKAKRAKWQEFVNSVTDPKSMALLKHALTKQPTVKIGLLKKPDGSFSKNFHDSIRTLMKEHFPGSVSLQNCREANSLLDYDISIQNRKNYKSRTHSTFINEQGFNLDDKFCIEADFSDSFITEENVQRSINSFGPKKTGGLDGFSPRVLQNLPFKYIQRLTRLFQAMLHLGYTPERWRVAKTIFIPKPSKNDYSLVRSHRPLTLTSFFLKTYEKLLLWEIENTVLKNNPISKQQHAFQKGKSCESAVSQLVDSIESAILREEYALCCQLDVQGAFDCLEPSAVIKAMKEKGIPSNISNWFSHYLSNRYVITDINGVKKPFKLQLGCPQGAITSPLAWNLVFESFIEKFKKGPVEVTCFADDACLLTKGIDPNALVDNMQYAINVALDWGNSKRLTFVPEKTVAIFFHRKRKFKEPKQLKVRGYSVEYSRTTKFLGIYLDTALNWSHHIEQKIVKAKRFLFMVRNAIGAIWGPQPRALKWAYNAFVLNSLAYCSMVWSHACNNSLTKYKFTKLNRLAALAMLPARKSTPSTGLEVTLGLMPVDLFIQKTALSGFLRVLPHNSTKWDGVGKSSLGHLRQGRKKLLEIGVSSVAFDNSNEINLHRKYSVCLKSFQKGTPDCSNTIVCYTDGSKLKNLVGYGYGITMGNHIMSSDNGSLDPKCSVFQAEIQAISSVCNDLLNWNRENVTIFSDSQAALAALDSFRLKSKTVIDCVEKLNLLGQQCQVELKWVKAHANHPGNEFADMAAKSGTTNQVNRSHALPPASWAKRLIYDFFIKIWNQRWISLKEARQTKIWFPTINMGKSEALIKLSRPELGLAVQMITGHNRLKRHESIVNSGVVDATCRLCLEEEETSWHLIGECPALWQQRGDSFESYQLNHPPDWKVPQFLNFLRKAKIAEINDRGAMPP